MPKTDQYGEYIVPSVALEPYTLIFDRQRQRPVLCLLGVLPLPVGAEIELSDPNLSATVVQVRLVVGGERGATLHLDVSVPPAYWGERDEMMEEVIAEAEETVAEAQEAVADGQGSLAPSIPLSSR
ncbi:MAG TPA: hypothetical protein VNL35_04130 [Chloroflexota bacterium]|nr:hypothetical protein [Chloroflexota bacterium]